MFAGGLNKQHLRMVGNLDNQGIEWYTWLSGMQKRVVFIT